MTRLLDTLGHIGPQHDDHLKLEYDVWNQVRPILIRKVFPCSWCMSETGATVPSRWTRLNMDACDAHRPRLEALGHKKPAKKARK